jgi:hypothetical protein
MSKYFALIFVVALGLYSVAFSQDPAGSPDKKSDVAVLSSFSAMSISVNDITSDTDGSPMSHLTTFRCRSTNGEFQIIDRTYKKIFNGTLTESEIAKLEKLYQKFRIDQVANIDFSADPELDLTEPFIVIIIKSTDGNMFGYMGYADKLGNNTQRVCAFLDSVGSIISNLLVK